jgi:hypothetical protein
VEQLVARSAHNREVAGSSPAAAIVVRVQHHPAREALLPALLAELPGAEVVVDPKPDRERNPWRTYRACLERSVPDRTSHLLIVQDDVRLCRNFLPAVEMLAGAEPLALFLGGAPQHSARLALAKPRYSVVPLHFASFVPVVALLWPRAHVESVLRWLETAKLPGGAGAKSDDAIIGRWSRKTRTQVYATTPSLVEHPDESASLIGKKAGAGRIVWRVAHHWIGPEADPLEQEWTRT